MESDGDWSWFLIIAENTVVVGAIQVVSVDWVFSFRIKFVGLGVIFGPHEVTENWAVLNILEGQ